MPTIRDEILVLAPPESVWRVLSEPSYIPKLYRDVITVEVDPPGPVAVGQKCRIVGRVGGMKVATSVRFTKVEKGKRLESGVVPGEAFSTFNHVVILTQKGWDTQVNVSFEYDVVPEFAARVPEPALMVRALSDSFRNYALNLKSLAELIPPAE